MSEDDEKPPLDAALRHLAEQQRRSLTSHPTPQELAAYHAGELLPEAEARILDHLAICRECSDLLLDLSGFADLKPPAGVPELTDQQVEEDWQALQARMRKEEEPPKANVVPIRPAGPPVRPERTYPVWLPVAASLLAVLGFSFGLYQSVQVGKLSQPGGTKLLDPAAITRGESEGLSISSHERGVVIMPRPEEGHPSYRVEIRRKDSVLWSAMVPVQDDSISIAIPSGFLEPGDYEIRLYGDEPVDYKLEVE